MEAVNLEGASLENQSIELRNSAEECVLWRCQNFKYVLDGFVDGRCGLHVYISVRVQGMYAGVTSKDKLGKVNKQSQLEMYQRLSGVIKQGILSNFGMP